MATKEQKIAQLEDKLRRLRAEAKRLDRRDETRRKILYGAAFLALAENVDAERRMKMMNQVDRFISRPVDREFLGLPTLEMKSPQPSSRRPPDVHDSTQLVPFQK